MSNKLSRNLGRAGLASMWALACVIESVYGHDTYAFVVAIYDMYQAGRSTAEIIRLASLGSKEPELLVIYA
jgi:hypothetical protein